MNWKGEVLPLAASAGEAFAATGGAVGVGTAEGGSWVRTICGFTRVTPFSSSRRLSRGRRATEQWTLSISAATVPCGDWNLVARPLSCTPLQMLNSISLIWTGPPSVWLARASTSLRNASERMNELIHIDPGPAANIRSTPRTPTAMRSQWRKRME